MFNQYRSAMQQAAAEDASPEGAFIKQADGKWILNGVEVQTGKDGVRLAIAMHLAVHGCVRWVAGKIVERRRTSGGAGLDRYVDVPPPRKEPGLNPYPDGFTPYTSVLCVGVDEEHLGELMTYSGASWGARFAFGRLLKPYSRRGERYLPIVTLSTRERRDVNGNIDPVFNIVGWGSPESFPDLYSDDMPPALGAPRAQVYPGVTPPVGRMTVESGAPPVRLVAPPLTSDMVGSLDDAFAGVDPNDALPY